MDMNVLGIIPARYASTRLEGKPLLDIGGKSMIRRVYEQCRKCDRLTDIVVATDDKRIYDECDMWHIPVTMTSSSHVNGTERCAEVLKSRDVAYDLVVNIQGDEPFIHPKAIEEIIAIFDNPQAEIGTLRKRISDQEELLNPSIIKVVSSMDKKALYFSRSPIPHLRGISSDQYLNHAVFYKHIGMYAYRSEVLLQIVNLEESCLESLEKLEQLRWLENGWNIYLNETTHESKSIDTMEDYLFVLEHINRYE